MSENVEILDNKVNFLSEITEEIYKEIDLNFDFSKYVFETNLTSTEVVLIIKALTIMNYRVFKNLDEHKHEFEEDDRFELILNNRRPTYNEFNMFLKSINKNIDTHKLLECLICQKIAFNICSLLLEDLNNY